MQEIKYLIGPRDLIGRIDSGYLENPLDPLAPRPSPHDPRPTTLDPRPSTLDLIFKTFWFVYNIII